MAKKMLFNVNEPEEVRAAIIEDGRLIEYDIETRLWEKNRNNIYCGVVVKVEPSIQSCFVDYGAKKHGFLPFREIHPDFWSRRVDEKRRVQIDEVIDRGQPVLVQVEREEIENKGAALTTYCTLPGRYIVLRPRETGIGISHKIEDLEERKELREIMKDLQPPEGFGCIVRTAGLGKTTPDLQRDLDYLVRLWKSIQREVRRDPRIGVVFQDGDLIMRTLRDYYDPEVDEILVDHRESYERSRAFFMAMMSSVPDLIKFYEGKRPLFSEYQIECQIAQVYARKIPLPSGGSIVIDTTEALVAIDVNSGKTQSSRGTEDTALKTNMEAVQEIARQLRLRDLGGLIVIDFIGMRIVRNMRDVERAMEDALKDDKARIKVGRMSASFGLLCLSRQRIRDAKERGHFVSCPSCQGLGHIANVEASALMILRHLHEVAVQTIYEKIEVMLPRDISLYLLNQKRSELLDLELEYDVEIFLQERDGFGWNLETDCVYHKRVQPYQKGHSRRRRPVLASALPAVDLQMIDNQRFETTAPTEESPRRLSLRNDQDTRLAQNERDARSGRENRSERTPQEPRSLREPPPERDPRTAQNERFERTSRTRTSQDPQQNEMPLPTTPTSTPPTQRSSRELRDERDARRERSFPTRPPQRSASRPSHDRTGEPFSREEKIPRQAEEASFQDAPAPFENAAISKFSPFEFRPIDGALPEGFPWFLRHLKPNTTTTPIDAAPPVISSSIAKAPLQEKTTNPNTATLNETTPHLSTQESLAIVDTAASKKTTPKSNHSTKNPTQASPQTGASLWNPEEIAKLRRSQRESAYRQERFATRTEETTVPSTHNADLSTPREIVEPDAANPNAIDTQTSSMDNIDLVTSSSMDNIDLVTSSSMDNIDLVASSSMDNIDPVESSAPKDDDADGQGRRWTEEELQFIREIIHLPFYEAQRKFRSRGFERSLGAFRHKYNKLHRSSRKP